MPLPIILAGAAGAALMGGIAIIKKESREAESAQSVLNKQNTYIDLGAALRKQDVDVLCSSTYAEYASVFPQIIDAYADLAEMFARLQNEGSIATPRNAYPLELEARVITRDASNFFLAEWAARREKFMCPPAPTDYPVEYQAQVQTETAGDKQARTFKWLLIGGVAVLAGMWIGKKMLEKGKKRNGKKGKSR